MRATLDRSLLAVPLAVVAALGIVALLHAASAGGDVGLRRTTFAPDAEGSQVPARRHRTMRRIWAASKARPSKVALRRLHHKARAAARGRSPVLSRAGDSPVVFTRLIPLPPSAPRPAIVSIYQDSTLRDGDAVMLEDGIHVFHAAGVWPHRPRDFVKLSMVAGLDWRLRATLDALDKSPPVRWSSNAGRSS